MRLRRDVYYGAQTSSRVEVWGPYHPNEVRAHAAAQAALSAPGTPVYRVRATSYADALRRLSKELS